MFCLVHFKVGKPTIYLKIINIEIERKIYMATFIYPTDTTRVTSGFRGDRPIIMDRPCRSRLSSNFMQQEGKLVVRIFQLVTVSVL